MGRIRWEKQWLTFYTQENVSLWFILPPNLGTWQKYKLLKDGADDVDYPYRQGAGDDKARSEA